LPTFSAGWAAAKVNVTATDAFVPVAGATA